MRPAAAAHRIHLPRSNKLTGAVSQNSGLQVEGSGEENALRVEE